MRNLLLAVVVLILAAAGSAAQDEKKKELAVIVGRTFISDQTVPNTNFFDNTVHSGKGFSFDFSYPAYGADTNGDRWRWKYRFYGTPMKTSTTGRT